jgi:hypothetical protein
LKKSAACPPDDERRRPERRIGSGAVDLSDWSSISPALRRLPLWRVEMGKMPPPASSLVSCCRRAAPTIMRSPPTNSLDMRLRVPRVRAGAISRGATSLGSLSSTIPTMDRRLLTKLFEGRLDELEGRRDADRDDTSGAGSPPLHSSRTMPCTPSASVMPRMPSASDRPLGVARGSIVEVRTCPETRQRQEEMNPETKTASGARL